MNIDPRALGNGLVGHNNDSPAYVIHTLLLLKVLIGGQKLAVARKGTLRRIWWLTVLIKRVR